MSFSHNAVVDLFCVKKKLYFFQTNVAFSLHFYYSLPISLKNSADLQLVTCVKMAIHI